MKTIYRRIAWSWFISWQWIGRASNKYLRFGANRCHVPYVCPLVTTKCNSELQCCSRVIIAAASLIVDFWRTESREDYTTILGCVVPTGIYLQIYLNRTLPLQPTNGCVSIVARDFVIYCEINKQRLTCEPRDTIVV